MFYKILNLCQIFVSRLWRIWFRKGRILDYNNEIKIIQAQFNKLKSTKKIQLEANIGTLFRKAIKPKIGLNLDNLDGVINIDFDNNTIDVGAKTTFHNITLITLPYNLMPQIVPELSSITVGGAVSGIGVESSSFRYGFVHNTVLEMDILLSSGEIVTCSPTNEYSDLFYAIPNSYGTLGYITRVRLSLMKTKQYVSLINTKFSNSKDAFEFMENNCKNKDIDFIEGVVYSPKEIVIVTGKFTNNNIGVTKYPSEGIYYKSIRQRLTDKLSIYDYCWRWDTDMFWSNIPVLENKWVRKICGRSLLNAVMLRPLSMLGFSKKGSSKSERIIQDIGIPLKNSAQFLEWVQENIDVYPMWLCPIKPQDKPEDGVTWNFHKEEYYCDIGIFGKKRTNFNPKEAYYNKLIENKMLELEGNKCFYSDSYFTKDQFHKCMNMEQYNKIKSKYDEHNLFQNIYDKVITKT